MAVLSLAWRGYCQSGGREVYAVAIAFSAPRLCFRLCQGCGPWDTGTMKALADLSLFLSYLESGQLILTPGKRLARQIRSSWLSQRSEKVTRPPAVQTVDAWLEQRWRSAVEAGHLPTAQLLSPVQEQALWQQTVRQDIDRRGDFSLSHPKAAALRAQTAWHKLLMHGGGQINNVWGLFEYDEDCSAFAAWARAFLAELDARQAVTRYQAYQQLLDLAPNHRPSIALYGVPALPPLTESVLNHLCDCLLYTSPSPRDKRQSRMPSSA